MSRLSKITDQLDEDEEILWSEVSNFNIMRRLDITSIFLLTVLATIAVFSFIRAYTNFTLANYFYSIFWIFGGFFFLATVVNQLAIAVMKSFRQQVYAITTSRIIIIDYADRVISISGKPFLALEKSRRCSYFDVYLTSEDEEEDNLNISFEAINDVTTLEKLLLRNFLKTDGVASS